MLSSFPGEEEGISWESAWGDGNRMLGFNPQPLQVYICPGPQLSCL